GCARGYTGLRDLAAAGALSAAASWPLDCGAGGTGLPESCDRAPSILALPASGCRNREFCWYRTAPTTAESGSTPRAAGDNRPLAPSPRRGHAVDHQSDFHPACFSRVAPGVTCPGVNCQ